MGSIGNGAFGEYRRGGSGSGSDSGGSTGGAGGGHSGSGEIECPKVIDNIKLENVATSEFYKKYNSVPKAKSEIQLRNKITNGRLVIELVDTKEIIGHLPVQYNYMQTCIKKYKYKGSILSSGTSPIPYIVVTIYV